MNESVPKNESELSQPVSFIGSMKDTMEIVGDIMAPIDVQWEADVE